MTGWLRRRRKPEDNPELQDSIEKRDTVLHEAFDAIHEVDRQHAEVIKEYAEAERQRRLRLRRRR